MSDLLSDAGAGTAFTLAALKATDELLALKNYSKSTRKNYRKGLSLFMAHFPGRKPSGITKDEVMQYLHHFRQSARWSASSQNQVISATKFFYEQVLKRPHEVYELPRTQRPQQLPKVISEDAILKIISGTENQKHKAMLSLMYAGGLRVSVTQSNLQTQ